MRQVRGAAFRRRDGVAAVIVASLVFLLLALTLLLRGLGGGSGYAYLALVFAALAVAAVVSAAYRRRGEEPGEHAGTMPAASFGTPGQQPPVVDTSEWGPPPAEGYATGGQVPPPAEAEQARPPEPGDEPGVEASPVHLSAWLDDQDTAVAVVDERPRYHRPTCRHLSGRRSVTLPASDARRSGFTPCAMCRPDGSMVRDAPPPG